MAPSKRKTLSLKEKLEAVNLVERGCFKKSEVAKKFGIPANSLSTILKNKDELKRKFSDGENVDRKRFREGNYTDVEASLFKWFKGVRAKNIPLNGPLLKEKASDFSKLLGIDFEPSNGWLQRFKDRHGIVFKSICGESASVDGRTTENWLNSSYSLLSQYAECDVYNADETGIFYQLLPDKTLAMKGETCSGGKNSKIRLTVMLCANMNGSDKRKLLVIGKSKHPRCFKKNEKLPVDYRANKKAWMTCELFNDWIKDFDEEMTKKKRKILLLIDNCTAHASEVVLKSITVHRFPPNTTSTLQPMDQGVIKNMKIFYRKNLLRKMLFDLEKGDSTKIDVKLAIEMLDSSWKSVSQQTIKNCWKHAGFDKCFKQETDPEFQEEENCIADEVWNHLDSKGVIPTEISLQDYLQIDESVLVEYENTDFDIVEQVKNKTVVESSDDENIIVEKTISNAVAVESLKNLKLYFSAKNISTTALNDVEILVETAIIKNSKKQLTIDSYFESI